MYRQFQVTIGHRLEVPEAYQLVRDSANDQDADYKLVLQLIPRLFRSSAACGLYNVMSLARLALTHAAQMHMLPAGCSMCVALHTDALVTGVGRQIALH